MNKNKLNVDSFAEGNNQIQSKEDKSLSNLGINYVVKIDTYNSDSILKLREYKRFDDNDLIPIDKRNKAIFYINEIIVSFFNQVNDEKYKLNISLFYFPPLNELELLILDATLDIKGFYEEESILTRSQIMDNLESELNDYIKYDCERKESFRIRSDGQPGEILWIKLSTMSEVINIY